jgi:hypothetical protein
MTDKLESMWEAHRQLQAAIPPKGRTPYDISDPKERQQFIMDMVYATEDELHEATDEVSWKPWASSEFFHRDAFVGELFDAWHFILNLLMVAQVTPEEFFQKYMEKNEINLARHAEGKYTGLEKCPECRRALDDPAVKCKMVGSVWVCMSSAAASSAISAS